MTYATDTRVEGFSLANRFAAFRSDIKTAMAKRSIYRTTMKELESLSARDLADLGISRPMIRSVAYEAAYGK